MASELIKRAVTALQEANNSSHAEKEKRYLSAIELWNQALSRVHDADSSVSVYWNLSLCYYYMAKALPRNEVEKIMTCIRTSFRNFSSSYLSAIKRDNAWFQKLTNKMEQALEFALIAVMDLPFDHRTSLLERSCRSKVPAVEARYHSEVATLFFQEAIRSFEVNNFIKANSLFEHALREINETDLRLLNYGVAALMELHNGVDLHVALCQSKHAFTNADKLFIETVYGSESIDFELVWQILDMIKHALLLVKDKDLEMEAICLSKIAFIYAKVLKMHIIARKLYNNVLVLTRALYPRDFTQAKWFQEAKLILQAYQDADFAKDQGAWLIEKQKYIVELSVELQAIELLRIKAMDEPTLTRDVPTKAFFEHIYAKHPPQGKDQVLGSFDGGLKKVCLRALLHYHPDKQDITWGSKWKVLCEEITKKINDIFVYYK